MLLSLPKMVRIDFAFLIGLDERAIIQYFIFTKDFFFFFFFFFNSVLRPFQDYFSSYETGQSVGGAKTGEPREKPPDTPEAKLGLSHMWPERGSNPH